MTETQTIEDVDIDAELDPGEIGHSYVVCNFCSKKQRAGTFVITVCGLIIRLTGKRGLQQCTDCRALLNRLTPAMVPCNFCGHVGS